MIPWYARWLAILAFSAIGFWLAFWHRHDPLLVVVALVVLAWAIAYKQRVRRRILCSSRHSPDQSPWGGWQNSVACTVTVTTSGRGEFPGREVLFEKWSAVSHRSFSSSGVETNSTTAQLFAKRRLAQP
jgi:hypothetical protein